MKYIIYLITIIVFFGFMSGLFFNLPIAGAVPNLIFLMVIFLALEEDSYEPYIAAILGGLLLDASSGVAPGSFLLGLVVLVFLVQLMFKQIIYYKFEQKYLSVLVILSYTFLLTWIWGFNSLGVYFHWAHSGLAALSIWKKFLPGLIYTLILMYPIYWLVDWIKVIINRRKPV